MLKSGQPATDNQDVMSAALRRTLRVPLPVEVLAADGVQPRFLGYLANVSASGLFVQCARPRDPGTHLALRFRIPCLAEPIRCTDAEVVWIRGYAGRSGPAPGMGLRMCALTHEVRTLLSQFCGEDAAADAAVGA